VYFTRLVLLMQDFAACIVATCMSENRSKIIWGYFKAQLLKLTVDF